MNMDKATTTPIYPTAIKQQIPNDFLDIMPAPQYTPLAPMNLNSNFSSSSSSSSRKPHSPSNGHVHPQEDDPREESHDSKTSPYMKKEEQVDNSQLMCGSHPDSLYNYGGGIDFMTLSYGDWEQMYQNYHYHYGNHDLSDHQIINENHYISQDGPSSTTHNHFGSVPTQMMQEQVINDKENMNDERNEQQIATNDESRGFELYQKSTPKQEKSFDTSNQCSSSTLNTSDVLTSDANLSHSVSEAIQHPRQTLSALEVENILNADLDEGVHINTKEVASAIASELKEHSISQTKFAKRILGLSQGTLSDLIHRPKPWEIIKTGRKTWIRMLNWVSQPLSTRLAILEVDTPISGMSAGRKRTHRKLESEQEEPALKKTRLVFTDIQKDTLKAIFKETQWPNRETKKQIAKHFQLEVATVSNFFQNSRRRERQMDLINK